MDYSMPGFPIFHQLPEFAQTHVTESVMTSNHLILCCPLLLLPSIFPSIRVFSNESAVSIMRSKYWSFSFSMSPSNEYSGLISFTIDWFDLLAVQETVKSLPTLTVLDCKEIKPVNCKGNQPSIFIGRTDAEAEDPILWPPDVKSQLIGRDPDAGKDWGWEEKGAAEHEMLDGITTSTDMSFSKLRDIVKEK